MHGAPWFQIVPGERPLSRTEAWRKLKSGWHTIDPKVVDVFLSVIDTKS